VVFLCVLVRHADHASANEHAPKADRVVGARIAKALVCDGKLWLLGANLSGKGGPGGGLISINLRTGARQLHFEKGVFDIANAGHDLLVLRQPGPKGHTLAVSSWRDGAYQDFPLLDYVDGEEPLALLSRAGAPVVLFQHSLSRFSPDQRKWRPVILQGELGSGVQISVAAPQNGNTAYVGLNRGEWGGGLRSVNLDTGVVSAVERRDSQELCEGPLNSDCDPVTGLIPDPQNKDCILAAVGLVHMMTHGGILRVCGTKVTPIWSKSVKDDLDGKLRMTEAVFGLAPAANGGFWAITWRALYLFAADGTNSSEYVLPKLKPVSGIYMSRDLPGVIVVRTDVNWAVSVSGYTPLLAPLDNSQ
jgi:hypothetical protein